jgi:hypothetical protein
MDNRNIVSGSTYKLQRVSLDIEVLICCLIVDFFLIKEKRIPFVSVLYYILLKSINSQISNQNFINKINIINEIKKMSKINKINETTKIDETNKIDEIDEIGESDVINETNKINEINKINKKRKEAAVIMSDCNQKTINENDYKYGEKYYFDKSGMNIEEEEAKKIHSGCKKLIETCCRIQIPNGFKLADCLPGMCFNLSNLDCVKSPIVQKVDLPNCECKHHVQCDVVAGYEIRAVGDVNFSVSLPICPKEGFCFPTNSHACCTSTVPVNKVISYTCCPKVCPSNIPCVDWTYAYFCTKIAEDCCGPYIQVELGVVLEYTGVCDCDEE